MKQIFFITLAAILALGGSLIGCGGEELPPQAPDKIIIATPRDTDEGLAIFDQMAAGPVMRAFVKYVNDTLGGIELSKYAETVPLELDRREISVAQWDVGTVTQGICDDIDAGTVHYLWGGPGTDCIYTMAPIANAEATVLFTFEGGATAVSNDPAKLAAWPYVFINLSYSDWYELPVLSKMLTQKLGREPKAYVIHVWGEHGQEYLATAEDNFDVVGDVEVPFAGSEMDADEVILRAMAALNKTPYDICIMASYPDHNIPLMASAMAHGFNPPAIAQGPGPNFGFFGYVFGGDPSVIEGLLCYATANFKTSAGVAQAYGLIADQLEADGTPQPPGTPGEAYIDYWGHPLYWAACQMWLQAIENAGDIGQELLREGLAATKDDPMTTILGETWYRMASANGGGNMDYLCHTGEIGQWQSGGIEIVGYPGITSDLPNYKTTANFIFPMTDKWAWLG